MATFGKTTKGSWNEDIDGTKWGCQFTAPENGILTAIRVYLLNYDLGTQVVCVYSDSLDAPDVLLASVTRADIPAAEGWYEFAGFNLQIKGGTKYWLALCAGAYTRTWCDSVACRARVQPRYANYPPPSNPFGAGTDYTDRQYSIYATYTPTDLQISVTPTSANLQVGQSQTFDATVVGGTPPYSISWLDKLTGEVLGQGVSLTVTFNSAGNYSIFAQVTDAVNATINSADIPVAVTEPPPPPPPTHQLTINSTPIQGIPFAIERVS